MNCLYWVFTSYTDPNIKELPLFMKYIVYGWEVCPTTLADHWQGYIELESKHRAPALANKLAKLGMRTAAKPKKFHGWVGNRKGTAEQAALYCRKGPNYPEGEEVWNEYKDTHPTFGEDAVVVEFGTMSKIIQGQRNDLKAIAEEIKNGSNLKDAVLDGKITNFQQLKVFQSLLPIFEAERRLPCMPTVHVYYGETGCSKSHQAFTENPDAYVCSFEGKYWDSYDGQKTVIFEDFRGDFCKFHELLRILDKNPLRLNVKFGCRQLVADKFIFTCPHHPREWYPGNIENYNQLDRRITTIKYFNVQYDTTYIPRPATHISDTSEHMAKEAGADIVAGALMSPVYRKDIVLDAEDKYYEDGDPDGYSNVYDDIEKLCTMDI